LSALVALIVVAMFALTAYNLSAPRSPLKRLLTATGSQDPELIKTLATSARVGTRTTRTTLAIAGFSLLGVAVVAVFGLSGQGVRDLRSQVVAAVTTLVAAIAGFYFGTRAAESPAAGGEPTTAPAAAPAVTGVSPPSGSVAGGDPVTVTGSGFTGATGVSFGTAAASILPGASDTQLTVTSPPNPAGTVDVTVTTPAGTSAITPADQFTYS
jgi:hypothetical protein